MSLKVLWLTHKFSRQAAVSAQKWRLQALGLAKCYSLDGGSSLGSPSSRKLPKASFVKEHSVDHAGILVMALNTILSSGLLETLDPFDGASNFESVAR